MRFIQRHFASPRHFLTIVFVGILSVFIQTTAFAQNESEASSTQKALEQLQNALKNEQQLSPETRKALGDFATAIQEELAKGRSGSSTEADRSSLVQDAATGTADDRLATRAEDAKPPWVDVFERLRLYGDMRLRHESSFNLDDKRDRHRQRLRLRLRLEYDHSDEFLLGAGLRTGNPDDPNSPYVTLGDGFDDFDISIDLAFVTYRPEWGEGLQITAGKFSNPIWRNPVYGELVWDADVNPEGIVAKWTRADAGPFDTLDLILGGYTVLEDENTDDVYLLALQAAGHVALSDQSWASLGVGYSLYGDPTPDGNLALLNNDNSGNAVVDRDGDGNADGFASDFGILNTIVAFTWTGWHQPVTFAGEYIYNTEANIDEDQGWALGVSYGQTKKKGDWRYYYQWQVIEQDAVFSAFSQDDFILQTNFRGHVFGAHYALAEKTDLHLWGLVTARDKTSPGPQTDSDQDQWRFRVDLTFKF